MSHETSLQLAEVLERQSSLNTAVAKALEAVAMTADKHDAEVAELREEVAALGHLVRTMQTALNERGYLHSVRVEP